ncbi:nucleoside monophosphate kinase [candidate division WWE3 bacterium]|uniref:Adenylate kinase n=1 Tax=candidate division WWE3 bacterium TaxID=2053526 RepID=A0A955LJF6_UNCKA|nr:nucleoside monophosphate kinase [candidate division WWE3 bacterium]
MIVLITGPQGSGKSTQGKLLAEKYSVPFVSVGDVLRTLEAEGSEIGLKAAKWWKKGKLIPDAIIREVVEEYFANHDVSRGFVMDGFPRDIKQYKWVHEVFPNAIDAVIYLSLDIDEIWRRLEKRRGLENRADENKEAIQERLDEFLSRTVPVVEKFKEDEIPYIEIDGAQSIEDIQDDILESLKSTREVTDR